MYRMENMRFCFSQDVRYLLWNSRVNYHDRLYPEPDESSSRYQNLLLLDPFSCYPRINTISLPKPFKKAL